MSFLAEVFDFEGEVCRGSYQRRIWRYAGMGNEGYVDVVVFVGAGFEELDLASAALCMALGDVIEYLEERKGVGTWGH
jgi:hypothetical protein